MRVPIHKQNLQENLRGLTMKGKNRNTEIATLIYFTSFPLSLLQSFSFFPSFVGQRQSASSFWSVLMMIWPTRGFVTYPIKQKSPKKSQNVPAFLPLWIIYTVVKGNTNFTFYYYLTKVYLLVEAEPISSLLWPGTPLELFLFVSLFSWHFANAVCSLRFPSSWVTDIFFPLCMP